MQPTMYQSSINGSYSSKHVRLHKVFHKCKYVLAYRRQSQRWLSLLMNIKHSIRETGLKDGCFVGSLYLPEGNWPIKKL